MTSGINLHELSLYQKNISKLDATHKEGFYDALSWPLSFCKESCPYDSLYEHLLKHPCKDVFAVYSYDNVKPKLKYKNKQVTFNKIVYFNDQSQGKLAVGSLFVSSNFSNLNTLIKYDVSFKEAYFTRHSSNNKSNLH